MNPGDPVLIEHSPGARLVPARWVCLLDDVHCQLEYSIDSDKLAWVWVKDVRRTTAEELLTMELDTP